MSTIFLICYINIYRWRQSISISITISGSFSFNIEYEEKNGNLLTVGSRVSASVGYRRMLQSRVRQFNVFVTCNCNTLELRNMDFVCTFDIQFFQIYRLFTVLPLVSKYSRRHKWKVTRCPIKLCAFINETYFHFYKVTTKWKLQGILI